MKTINDLFKSIYGSEPKNFEQLHKFIECLKERLSYREKNYVFEAFHVDLFDEDEIEKRIKTLMLHPICKKRILGIEDEIDEIYKQCKEEKVISISYIQRQFSIGFPSAKKIINEMVDRGLISPLTNGTYKVIKR